MTDSPNGRRVLVAIVTGKVGGLIQAWRERHDPEQARRLPPHATLCYWVPEEHEAEALERQIHHAFTEPIDVPLGGVSEFTNRDGTFFVEVGHSERLNDARTRLYDGTFLHLAGRSDFTWHVTCVRYPDEARRSGLRAAAAELSGLLATDPVWTLDTVGWLELRGDRYEPIRTWSIGPADRSGEG